MNSLVHRLINAHRDLTVEFDFSQKQADGLILTLSETLEQIFERSDKRIADMEARSDERFEKAKAESERRFEKAEAESERRFEKAEAASERRFERSNAEISQKFENFENRIQKRFDEHEARMVNRFDVVESRLTKAETRLDTIGWRTAAAAAGGSAGMIGFVAGLFTVFQNFVG